MQAQLGAHGLSLPASFTGTLPCADCEGISWHLDLWPEQGYHLRRVWLGGGGEESDSERRRDEVGRWHADPERNAIVLHGAGEMPLQFEVKSPSKLRLLDRSGQPIVSDLNYALSGSGSLSETDLEDLFLGGVMTYLADAALFEDCMTGRRYPIAQEADYLALERAYLEDRAEPGAPLYVHIEGALLMRPAMEGPDRRSLVVSRFLKTRPGISCERQRANTALTNTYWRIDKLQGHAIEVVDGHREPHLILRVGDNNRFTATLGCNRFNGGYTTGSDTLEFSAGASTMMACPPPLNEYEGLFTATLDAASRYRINGETLIIEDQTGEVIALCTAVYLP
jgi:copper homeostasis protein (lipoprotein)